MRVSVRISMVLWAVIFLSLVCYIVSRLLFFKQLFFAHAGIAITQEQVAAAYNATDRTRIQYIPKIVHQVFHNWRDPGNDTLPSDWVAVRQNCIDINPDFEFKVRTASTVQCRSCWPTLRNHNANAQLCSCGPRRRRATSSRPSTRGS
jgi:hypothetical protein